MKLVEIPTVGGHALDCLLWLMGTAVTAAGGSPAKSLGGAVMVQRHSGRDSLKALTEQKCMVTLTAIM